MKWFLYISFFCTGLTVRAQTPDDLLETARSFMQQSDFVNAIVVLNRASAQSPANLNIKKELGLAYFYNKQNDQAIEVIKPLLDKEEIDDQTFLIAANIYKQLGNVKEADKVYKRGLKKFPESGTIYNDYGEMLNFIGGKDAIQQFEAGIKVEPAYSRNYYNAAKFYAANNDPVWALLYGEIFANMEPGGLRSTETKQMLLRQYKQLFSTPDLETAYRHYTGFAKQFVQLMNKQSTLASSGINTESLIMIRTRFLLDLLSITDNKYPYYLFDHQLQLLQEGMFEAYNQWLFGSSENINAYQNWVNTHAEENKVFTSFQKSRVFKMPAGQYYR